MGLPYVSDPAVTRHLAAFLAPAQRRPATAAPDAILFNGGVFQPPALRDRLLEVMQRLVRPARAAVAAAGADEPVARPGRGLGRGVLRLAAAHRRQAHRRRHRPLVLHRHRGRRHAASRSRDATLAPCVCVVPQHLEEGRSRAAEAGAGTGPRPAGAVPAVHLDGARRRQGRRRAARRAGATAATAAAAHGPARRQAQRHQARAGHAGGALDGDRHAGTVLRGQGGRQPLAAGVQRPRPGQGADGRRRTAAERGRAPSPTSGRKRRCRRRPA